MVNKGRWQEATLNDEDMKTQGALEAAGGSKDVQWQMFLVNGSKPGLLTGAVLW